MTTTSSSSSSVKHKLTAMKAAGATREDIMEFFRGLATLPGQEPISREEAEAILIAHGVLGGPHG